MPGHRLREKHITKCSVQCSLTYLKSVCAQTQTYTHENTYTNITHTIITHTQKYTKKHIIKVQLFFALFSSSSSHSSFSLAAHCFMVITSKLWHECTSLGFLVKSILFASLLLKCSFILSCWFNAFLSALLISSCLLPYLKLEIKVNLVILRGCQGMPTAVIFFRASTVAVETKNVSFTFI